MNFRWTWLNPWHWVRKILPRTLLMRSLLIITLPILLLQIVVMSVFVDNHWRKITSRLAFSVAGEVAIFADELDSANTTHVDQQKLDVIANYAAQNLDLLVSFEENARINPEVNTRGAWEKFTVAALSKAIREQVRRPYSLSVSDADDWVNIGIQLDNGVLRVLALDRRLFSSSAYIFLFWVWGSSLILLTIAIVFMRNQIKPIKRLAWAAEHMGMGREIMPFKPEGAREVRQAGKAFLEMHDRITRQIEQRTIMLAGISHDLRTPLTRLKLGLSLMGTKANDMRTGSAGESEEIAALEQDIVDMERMINSYLDFVRLENQSEQSESFDMAQLLQKLCEQARRQAQSQNKSLEILEDIPQSIDFYGRPLSLERAIANVIGNALKYGTIVSVRATEKVAQKQEQKSDQIGGKKYVRIEIEDNGIGIPHDKYDDVFKPFFRLDPARSVARSANGGGVGLGLCITRDIIHRHGGTIELAGAEGGGLRVILSLPIMTQNLLG